LDLGRNVNGRDLSTPRATGWLHADIVAAHGHKSD